MNKKIFAMLLIVLSFVLILTMAACKEENNKKNTESSESTPAQTEEVYDGPTPDHLPDTIESATGTFHVLSRDSVGWGVRDIYAEEDSGDTITNAIYERNLELEDKYGITIKETKIDTDAIYNSLYQSVSGGESLYDAVDMNLMTSFQAASSKLLLDLETDIPNINLDNPWWDQGTRNDFSIKNKLYYTASDINLMSYMATWVAVYNKDIIADLGYDEDYIYNMVREGKWTLDEYYKLVKSFTKDLDNDNNMTSKDQYGTSMQGGGPDGFLLCAGFRYCTKNEDDELVFNEFDDHDLDILQKVMKIASPSTAYNSHNQSQNEAFATESENGRTMFIEGRSIFFTETLESVDTYRDMDSNFGIVPLPKYDESSDYTSYIHYWGGSAISVPITAPELEKTGVMLEYMAYLSNRMVTPVYFSKVVEGKFSRDEDSLDMIENYIMKNRVFDLLMSARGSIDSLPDIMLNLINTETPAFASTYKRSSRNVASKLEEYNNSFE